MNTSWDARLHKLYYQDKYQKGIHSTYHRVNDRKGNDIIPRAYVTDWLRKQESYQINQRILKPRHIRPIVAKRPFHIVQMDLIDFTNKPSLQFRYIVVVIDVFSRYVWAKAITSKTPDKVLMAYQSILKNSRFKETPTLLMSDNGGEFKGVFHEYVERHITSLGGRPESQGVVERVNQTLKRALIRRGGAWSRELSTIVDQYNSSYHSTIKDKPENVLLYGTDKTKALHDRMSKRRITLHPERRQVSLIVGDKVRLRRTKGMLDKHATHNWSEHIYKVTKITRAHKPYSTTRYTIMADGISYGNYVREDLLKVY